MAKLCTFFLSTTAFVMMHCDALKLLSTWDESEIFKDMGVGSEFATQMQKLGFNYKPTYFPGNNYCSSGRMQDSNKRGIRVLENGNINLYTGSSAWTSLNFDVENKDADVKKVEIARRDKYKKKLADLTTSKKATGRAVAAVCASMAVELSNKYFMMTVKADQSYGSCVTFRTCKSGADLAAFTSLKPTNLGPFLFDSKGIAWAKNDPIVKNIAGEEFEIMATGSFTMLSLQELSSNKTMLKANATIDRAGSRCGATYIQNMMLTGEWVKDLGVPQIQVRAESSVSKKDALQVNFAGEWKHASAHFPFEAVRKSSARSFILQLHKVEIEITIDSHRIHDASTITNRFANFLNVNFKGLSKLSDVSLGGLLGKDSHEAAARIPEGCDSSSKLLSNDAIAMLSEVQIE